MCEKSFRSEGPNPEEWRAFRASLISKGIKTTSDDDAKSATHPNPSGSPQQRAAKNEALLREQNPRLYKEYMEGGWAHLTTTPEVGGLLVRQPIEAQLMTQARQGGEGWGRRLRERLREQVPREDGESDEAWEARAESWGRKVPYMYKLAQSLLSDTIQEISNNPNGMTRVRMELLEQYVQYQETWQEVVLMLDHDPKSSSGVVINRPLRASLNDVRVAALLLFGEERARAEAERALLLQFVAAFGQDGVLYLGGGEGQRAPGVMIHGIAGLEGAEEISPGTGIYRGGIRAAVARVLAEEASPLDFRFFVGRREWPSPDAPLAAAIARGEYQAVACARPLALKQCLALPKPLWHEVMERCGGDALALSRLELVRRDDLDDQDMQDEGQTEDEARGDPKPDGTGSQS